MPIWKTLPVTDQPSLTLKHWQVVELPDGDRHFVGYVTENQEGRVSSPIRGFDTKRLLGVTATGRVYRLRGAPGMHSDAEYVWGQWRRLYDLTEWKDVSAEVWQDHLRTAGVQRSSRVRPLKTVN